MVVSSNRDSIHEINTWPKEVEDKLMDLQPGEIVKVRLNPSKWRTVMEQRGTSQDMQRPVSSGMVRKVGEHGIPSPWTVRFDRIPYQIGFLEGYDVNGNARYTHPVFNQNGELVFNGDRVGDRERFMVIQLHPQMRMDPISGLERNPWKFEIVDTEKESTGITQNFEVKLALLNRVKDLNESSLNTLVSAGMYERSFLGRPDLEGKAKSSRAILIKMVEDGKFRELNELLKKLDDINKIAIVHDALNNKKLICTEAKLMRYDGREICTFAEPISMPNNEVAAINAFRYAAHEPDFEKHVIDFFRETYEAAKTTTHKARRGTKSEE
jgi:hypothetical protein